MPAVCGSGIHVATSLLVKSGYLTPITLAPWAIPSCMGFRLRELDVSPSSFFSSKERSEEPILIDHTKAILSAGKRLSSRAKASNPPAEAPIRWEMNLAELWQFWPAWLEHRGSLS